MGFIDVTAVKEPLVLQTPSVSTTPTSFVTTPSRQVVTDLVTSSHDDDSCSTAPDQQHQITSSSSKPSSLLHASISLDDSDWEIDDEASLRRYHLDFARPADIPMPVRVWSGTRLGTTLVATFIQIAYRCTTTTSGTLTHHAVGIVEI
jgi:hypothetical protein